jgi:hypothetical protein
MFEDNQDEKCIVHFSIRNYGKSHSFHGYFDDFVTWPEVLDEIVKTLEAAYGYAFNIDIETENGLMGVYHKGKEEDDAGN